MTDQLPRPVPLFEIEPEDTTDYKQLGFTDEDDCKLATLLYRTWYLYGKLVQDEKLWGILNAPEEKNSNTFYLQNSLVNSIHELGCALGDARYHLNRLRR